LVANVVEEVDAMKSLGVMFQTPGLSVELCVQSVLRQCGQEALFAENVT